jgi:hypothetical protein
MTVKVFICEFICKSNTVWCTGWMAFAKTLTGGEVRGSIPMDSINFSFVLLIKKNQNTQLILI